ncbi:hypothetical protein IHN63_00230 [Deinococcus sp. 6YEL10]|uniref:LamG domain-containing protein n=1 Tax=Deinococcus sp. 6YEL10 TaxID=2745870 RepID=UPI001E49EDC5|nr:LamG domain-containing protein [Deinococcus sp. 6YEL10]MCD0159725.1 hypothetical protein [Deinococcus sp. 6YEL10]
MIRIRNGVVTATNHTREGVTAAPDRTGWTLLPGTRPVLSGPAGDVTVTGTCSVSPRGHQGTAALHVERATQNLLTDQGFRAISGTWGGLSAEKNETIPLVTPHGVRNVRHSQWKYTGSGGICAFQYGNSVPVSGSATYTFSTHHRPSYGNRHANLIYLREYDAQGTQLSERGLYAAPNTQPLGDGWEYAWATFTTNPATTRVTLQAYMYVFDELWAYDPQLEPGSSPTAYTASTRPAGQLDFPVPPAGTVTGYVRVTDQNPGNGAALLSMTTGSGQRASIVHSSGSVLLGEWATATPTYVGFGTLASLRDNWRHVALTWEGGDVRLYLDGAQVAAVSKAFTAFASMSLGGPASPLNALWSNVRLFPRCLSAGEVGAVNRAALIGFQGAQAYTGQLREGDLPFPADATYVPLNGKLDTYGAVNTRPVSASGVRWVHGRRWGSALFADRAAPNLNTFGLTAYNNFPGDVEVTVTSGYARYDGQPEYLVSIRPLTAAGVSTCRNVSSGVGVMTSGILTWNANTDYAASILLRPGPRQVKSVTVTGLRSNISGWSAPDTPLTAGTYTTYTTRLAASGSARTDRKFFGLICPDINLGETYTVTLTGLCVTSGPVASPPGADRSDSALLYRLPFAASGTLAWSQQADRPAPAATEVIFDGADFNGTRLMYVARLTNGNLALWTAAGGTLTLGPADTQPHRWAITWDAATLRLYRDGQLVTTHAVNVSAAMASVRELMIGRARDTLDNPSNSAISHVLLLGRALTQSEIPNVTALALTGQSSVKGTTLHVPRLIEGA